MSAIIDTRSWLVYKLEHEPTLKPLIGQRVYRDTVPREAEYPCILIGYLGSVEFGHNQTAIVSERRTVGALRFAVRVIGTNSDPNVETIVDEIEKSLVGSGGTFGGWTIQNVRQEETLELFESENDTEYQYLGAVYRINLKRV